MGLFVGHAAVANAATIIDPSRVLFLYDPGPRDGGSEKDQLAVLNAWLFEYNATTEPDLPAPATYGSENIGFPKDGLTTIDLDVSGFNYLKIKWSGKWQYYYIGGLTGEYRFDSTVKNQNGKDQAGSHYTFFMPTRVPDGGATLWLMGSALFGLGLFGRRKK